LLVAASTPAWHIRCRQGAVHPALRGTRRRSNLEVRLDGGRSSVWFRPLDSRCLSGALGKEIELGVPAGALAAGRRHDQGRVVPELRGQRAAGGVPPRCAERDTANPSSPSFPRRRRAVRGKSACALGGFLSDFEPRKAVLAGLVPWAFSPRTSGANVTFRTGLQRPRLLRFARNDRSK
jgi:hypothetical protein